MVFFTCSSCGQSIKKNQVEKHYQEQCRSCKSLSCMDCGKEFWGNDYKLHTKCISENEKYGGKDYKPKENKGEVKQGQWMEHIKSAIAGAQVSKDLRYLLEQIMISDNVPRKKIKFENFVKNSIRVKNPKLIPEAWKLFSKAHEEQINANKQNKPNAPDKEQMPNNVNQTSENTQNEEPQVYFHVKKKKNKKRKAEEISQEEEISVKRKKKETLGNDQTEESSEITNNLEEENEEGDSHEEKKKFRWEKIIKTVLRQEPDQTLPVKKLRKKVLAEYFAHGGENRPLSGVELKVKFEKKITKNPKFKVHKERVTLVH